MKRLYFLVFILLIPALGSAQHPTSPPEPHQQAIEIHNQAMQDHAHAAEMARQAHEEHTRIHNEAVENARNQAICQTCQDQGKIDCDHQIKKGNIFSRMRARKADKNK